MLKMITKTKPSTSVLLLIFKNLTRSLNMTKALSFKRDLLQRARNFHKY